MRCSGARTIGILSLGFFGEKTVGEVIAFKQSAGKLRLRPVPPGSGIVIVFAGLWQDHSREAESKQKPPHRKRPNGKRGKTGMAPPAQGSQQL